jgi:hypothetical protein
VALIKDSKNGRADGGYTRLLGNAKLGSLISKLHATVITNGTELEKIILQRVNNVMTEEKFDNFLNGELDMGNYVITKKLFKSKIQDALNTNYQPDFMIIIVNENKIYIIELKDGDAFDTKKAAGELSTLLDVKNSMETFLGRKFKKSNLKKYDVEIKFCSFNQLNKQKIVEGLKNRIDLNMAMNGQELCQLMGIDYNEIVELRKQEQDENLKYFIEKIQEIPEVKNMLDQSK